MTMHIDSYRQVAFHNLSVIKFFDKTDMTPLLALSSTSLSPPCTNMNMLVGHRKHWISALVLLSLALSLTLFPTYTIISKAVRRPRTRSMDSHPSR